MRKTVLRMGLILFAVAILGIEVFGYTPIPAPVIPNGTPFVWDANQIDPNTPVIDAIIKTVGESYTRYIYVTDPNGKTVTLTAPDYIVSAATSRIDPNDPAGLAKIFRFPITRTVNVIGFSRHVLMAQSSGGTKQRTIIENGLQSTKPEFTGCRSY